MSKIDDDLLINVEILQPPPHLCKKEEFIGASVIGKVEPSQSNLNQEFNVQ